jgi:hypothetical protein
MRRAQIIMKNLYFLALTFILLSCDGSSGFDKRDGSKSKTPTGFGSDELRPDYSCDNYEIPAISANSAGGLFHSELVSSSLEESYCLYPKRRRTALEFLLSAHEGVAPENSKDDNRGSFRKFTNWAQAALELQDEEQIAKINKMLESSSAKPWNYGSSFDIPVVGFACSREGDYDFVAFLLAKVVALSRSAKIGLSKAAEDKILNELLPLYGNPPKEHKTKFKLDGIICGSFMVPETENHTIMVNISKYLTNDLRGIDNEANGFNAWMVEHMDIFLRDYFDEYNSKPYQQYAIEPILTLAALSSSDKVRHAALNVVEQIMSMVAAQSNELRRFSPFRRQPGYKEKTESFEGNGIMGMAAIYSGRHSKLLTNSKTNLGESIISAAVLFEEVPIRSVVMSLYTGRDKMKYEQDFYYHGNEEHYSATANYLLSSSGRFHAYEQCPETTILPGGSCLTDQQHGWATATILIPTKLASSDYNNMIHFKGNSNLKKKNNNCVKNGFACGLRPSIPDWITSLCKPTVDGEWTFINMNSNEEAECNQGFYVALRKKDNIGILDVENSPTMDFSAYSQAIMSNNQNSLTKNQKSSFKKADAREIEYLISDDYKVGSHVLPKLSPKGYVASGDIVDNTSGSLMINSPVTGDSLELKN